MLVLTRKLGAVLCIAKGEGEPFEIEVHVVEIRGNQVRLGIVAPRTMTVLRKEILDAKSPKKRDAGKD